MVTSAKHTGRAVSMPVGVMLGACTSLVTMFACTGLLAYLIHGEYIPPSAMGYGVMFIQFLSAALGAILASEKVKHLHLQVSLLAGAGYLAVLLGIHGLFFGGRIVGLGMTAILIAAGSLLPPLLRSRQGRGVGKRHRRGVIR